MARTKQHTPKHNPFKLSSAPRKNKFSLTKSRISFNDSKILGDKTWENARSFVQDSRKLCKNSKGEDVPSRVYSKKLERPTGQKATCVSLDPNERIVSIRCYSTDVVKLYCDWNIAEINFANYPTATTRKAIDSGLKFIPDKDNLELNSGYSVRQRKDNQQLTNYYDKKSETRVIYDFGKSGGRAFLNWDTDTVHNNFEASRSISTHVSDEWDECGSCEKEGESSMWSVCNHPGCDAPICGQCVQHGTCTYHGYNEEY